MIEKHDANPGVVFSIINIVLCTRKGIVAINIEGVTLHRLFNLKAQQIIKPGDYLKYDNLPLKTLMLSYSHMSPP